MAESPGESLGLCLACEVGEIVESARAYGCNRWKRADGDCHFTIWKNVAGHAITPDEAQALIAGETIGPFALTSAAGKSFEASFQIDDQGSGHLAFVFAPRASQATGTDDLPF